MPGGAFSLVYGGIGLLIAITVTWRIRAALREPRRPDGWAICVAMLTSGVGFLSATPPLYTAIGTTTGIPNLATLIVYASIIISGCGMWIWTFFMLVPGADDIEQVRQRGVRGARAILAAVTAVVITLAILFATAPVHDEPHILDFDHHYAREPQVLAFLIVYWAAYCVGLTRVALLCRQSWPTVRELTWLRRAVRCLATGAIVALGYAAGKVIAVVGVWFGAPTFLLNTAIAPAFASIGAVLILAGYGMSAIPKLQDLVFQARALPRLRPLWADLRKIDHTLELHWRHSWHERFAIRKRCYRSMQEILDWIQLLRPHLAPENTAIAQHHADTAGLTGPQRTVAIEAARVAAALQAWDDHTPPRSEPYEHWHAAAGGRAAQLRTLLAIADAYSAPCPVVSGTLNDLSTPSPPTA